MTGGAPAPAVAELRIIHQGRFLPDDKTLKGGPRPPALPARGWGWGAARKALLASARGRRQRLPRRQTEQPLGTTPSSALGPDTLRRPTPCAQIAKSPMARRRRCTSSSSRSRRKRRGTRAAPRTTKRQNARASSADPRPCVRRRGRWTPLSRSAHALRRGAALDARAPRRAARAAGAVGRAAARRRWLLSRFSEQTG